MTRLSELVRPAPDRSSRLPAWLLQLAEIGIVTDDPEIRRRQTFANIAAFAVAFGAGSHLIINGVHAFWALMPIHVYNLIVFVLALAAPRLHRFGDNVAACFLAALVFGAHNFVIFALGIDSGLQIYFTLAGAMLFIFWVQHWRLFLVFYLLAFAGLVITGQFASHTGFLLPHDAAFRESLFFQGLVNAIIINALLIAYALSALRRAEVEAARQFARSEALLHVILPEAIARRLKSGRERRIADHVDCASVLFADIAGFTPAARSVSPEELVGYLDRLISAFDEVCGRHGVDKIKTIGDSYMAVGGLDGDARAGALAVGRVALAMRETMKRHGQLGQHAVTLRIGIHCGPLVAGVIGDARVSYDVWGDAVNVAQRMEAHGAPGRIQVSGSFAELVRDAFELEPRGRVSAKGVGVVETWFLEAEPGATADGKGASPALVAPGRAMKRGRQAAQ